MASDSPLVEKNHDLMAALALLTAAAGWIVPGLGHLLWRQWGRAIFLFLTVGALAWIGFAMRGQLFARNSGDPFGALGFLADACAGAFYFLPRVIHWAGPDVSRAAGDYGTRFLAAAGVVNLLGVLDAYGIAMGRKR
jgi:hypothetical protein